MGEKMNLYLPNGFLNVDELINAPEPFVFVHGGRGVGKTYGALKAALKHKFIYTRRLQSELDVINKPEYMPFKALMADDPGLHIGINSISKYNAAFYNQAETEAGWVNAGSPIGYTAALSTFANIRGFDASDVDLWIYDEFIPEAHVRPIKEEGKAFLNAYETINRNRELKGGKPLKVICLANSNRLANPIYVELDLVSVAERMKRRGKNFYRDAKTGILMVDPFDSPISEAKSETALYKLANRDSDFYNMSIGNVFDDLELSSVSPANLKEFKPLVTVGDITIYKHKTSGEYYGSRHRSGNPPVYSPRGTDGARFKRDYGKLWVKYLENKLKFEDYATEALFNVYWD